MKSLLVRPTLNHLWNVEFPEVVEHNLTIIRKYNPATLHVEKFFNATDAFAPQLTLMTQQERASATSAAMSYKDNDRDAFINGILAIGRIATRMPLDAESDAGEKIVALFDKHGTDIAEANYTAETRRINDFCADVDASPTLQAALATLGLANVYAALKRTNSEFDQLVFQRSSEQADKVRIEVRPLRTACSATLVDLWNALEHAAAMFDDVDFTPLFTELNAYNTAIRTALRARAARRKAGQKVESEQPITANNGQ